MNIKPYYELFEEIYERVNADNEGNVAAYIPELAKIDPEKFGVYISTVDCDKSSCIGFGDYQESFSIQSIVKVLSLVLAIKSGEKLWDRVGVEPSGSSFNSLVQLEFERGIPRNPFINAGAIVIADILLNTLTNPEQEFIQFVRSLCGNQDINYDLTIAKSEKKHGYRNAALVNMIKSYGNIRHQPEDTLDFYFKMCSIKMTCEEVSKTFLFLANEGINPLNGQEIITKRQNQRVNAVMQLCGFYNEAGEFAFRVGLPAKSGVGGGIIAIHPKQYSLAVWSPRLNEKGNSYRGFRFLEEFTTETSSIF